MNRHTPIAAQLEFYYPDAKRCSANLNWLQQGPPSWSISVKTDQGVLGLSDGGARMQVDGVDMSDGDSAAALSGEYPRLYERMADLVDRKACDVDLRPMVLVADAFAIGERLLVSDFEW